MGFLTLLLPIISLVSFIGFIWLVRNAFRSSTGWGLAVLFLSPFSAIFYAVKNWEDSKKPFLIYSGSTVAGILVMVMIFANLGGFQAVALANDIRSGEISEEQAAGFINDQMDRMEASGMLDAQGQADLEQMRGMMDQISGDAVPASDPANDSLGMETTAVRPQITDPEAVSSPAVVEALRLRAQETAREERRAAAGPIRVTDAGRYIGQVLTAVGTDGIEHTGKLASSDKDSLWLEQYFSGGTFSVELKKSQVRSLEVLDR